MRQELGSNGSIRSSALWGKPAKGEVRSSALWGKGGRGFATSLVTLVLALGMPLAATAGSGSGSGGQQAYASPSLLAKAKANPGATLNVVIQSQNGAKAAEKVLAKGNGSLTKRLGLVKAVAAKVPAARLATILKNPNVLAVTEDAPLVASSNKQQWPYVSGVMKSWGAAKSGLKVPAIAVVDSGIDPTRLDFAGRIVANVNLSTLSPNSPGDGRGHGTFVAGIAAGSVPGYTGAAPDAPIVSIDVMDDYGVARTSDVIYAAQWIYENRGKYNIRVANFSLHTAVPTSFMYDPLNKAVQKLWFEGVVVVAAAGNYAKEGAMSGVPYAPGNDPFVITVGAVDIDGNVSVNNDNTAPWSAFGYTYDGFAKPDVGAPGRYMVGAVPVTSTLYAERPDRIVAPGYMQMSGTSFAAPVVAGAAAYLLAKNPGWTPDQVKGAIMVAAKPVPYSQPLASGVGQLDMNKAVAVIDPPNPNLALNEFVVSESGGSGKVFDAASWASVAESDASWASASWSSASWASASWSSASWASASWASASWASASWSSASWSSDSEADVSQSDASWASNSEDDALAEGGYFLDLVNLYAAEVENETDLNGDGILGEPTVLAQTTVSTLP